LTWHEIGILSPALPARLANIIGQKPVFDIIDGRPLHHILHVKAAKAKP
jgi:hypothetical protein